MKVTTFGILSLFWLTASLPAFAQLSSDSFRDVNASGPFPIYVAVQETYGKDFDEYKYLSRLFADQFGASKRRNLWGGEASIGVMFNEDILRNVTIEPICFRYLQRSTREGDNRLRYIHQTSSFRIGYRKNIFYPVTLHVLVGFIYFSQQVARIDRIDSVGSYSSSRVSKVDGVFRDGFRKNKSIIPGVEGKVRLNIIDAVSSSGGLGAYIELYASRINKQPLAAQRLFPIQSSNLETDKWNSSISLGLVIPLALRVKRLFREKSK
jgi:hypothetical protein